MDSSYLVGVELDDDERRMLRAAMLEWIGPARPTLPLVIAMGFDGLDTFSDEVMRLRSALEHRAAMTVQDWHRVLMGAEIVFVSDVVGSGLDWPITTGFSDASTIAMLRAIQRKMPRWRGSVQFNITEGGQAVIANPERPTA
ncbi:hypothetical protein [Leifsonia sp. TF02-11]|uniref:hypothetical protein n=1 Tax=Leifsonia sp. TF02-11 TaxID=2815212 RepID=UPI001AA0E202|nr:hypothetical protein [Leifsonia sp. TF02-11]MBO1740477.1 hypothetical protein [Leifsonia sp. TF02-11]